MRKIKKRRKLKLWVIKFLVYFNIFLVLSIYTAVNVKRINKQRAYEKTYEYKLITFGYKKKDAKYIDKKLNSKNKDFILSDEFDNNYLKIIKSKYYLDKNFKEYMEYQKSHEDEEISNIIAIVNVHANKGWYNIALETDTSKEFLIIANKFYHLPEGFVRDDIKKISLQYAYSDNYASEVVIDAFDKMYHDVKDELGIRLMVNSSYRSFNDQEEIYNEFRKVSQAYADSYAARPGYSEHQTGLALDITSLEHPFIKEFTESDEFSWLKNNAHKYGFILRYPQGKEHITGYSNESWHFRYVGIDIATQIFNEGITFDEYYAYYIEK